jgi:hypothetical protein
MPITQVAVYKWVGEGETMSGQGEQLYLKVGPFLVYDAEVGDLH